MAGADTARRPKRRSGKAAVYLAPFIVSLRSPPCGFRYTKTAAGVWGHKGGIKGGILPHFYPTFGYTRRHFWRHLSPKKGVKRGYFTPNVPPIYPQYTPKMARVGHGRRPCHCPPRAGGARGARPACGLRPPDMRPTAAEYAAYGRPACGGYGRRRRVQGGSIPPRTGSGLPDPLEEDLGSSPSLCKGPQKTPADLFKTS